MQFKYYLIILTIFSLSAVNPTGADQEKFANHDNWTGTLADGSAITAKDLGRMLKGHSQWLDSGGKSGRKLNLAKADLRSAHLPGVNLKMAVLNGVNLQEATLTGADLSKAFLVEADMGGAELSDARFIEADLTGAEFARATMNRADLSEAKLADAHFFRAELIDAILVNSDLRRAPLFKSNLSGADLSGANLEGAGLNEAILKAVNLKDTNLAKVDLREANLQGFHLAKARMRGANLAEANLSGANLVRADLSGSNLRGVDFSQAILIGTNFKNAQADFADFSQSIFEPESVAGLNFLGTRGFSTIRFNNSRQIDELRKMAKQSGLRNEERSLTSALHKYRLKGKPPHEQFFEFIWLGFLTDFGAEPWRSLKWLGFSVLIFTPLYVISLFLRGADGIYKICLPDRMKTDLDGCEPERLYKPGFKALGYAFYFSVLSAFSMGWRDLNIGNWIVRMQWKEYTLRSSGWVRTISGFQSLFSVYLLAIWLLTYFGRPFE
jgi:uncharacterized protein YjbI with pentapeptide repeats